MTHTTQGSSLASSERAGDGVWTLLVVGPGLMGTYPIGSSGAVTIGRDADADVRLDHARISRHHARIHVGPSCTVEDLGSRNGTAVAGRALARGTRVALAAGDSFTAGPFTFLLIGAGAAPEAEPSALVIDDPGPQPPPALLLTVAGSPLTVLIRGETGVGKEVLAETLHRHSGRAGRLLRLNCAAFAGELLESELFGHERGAFTGATATKPGLLEVAAGGTVFLDEIGDLPLALQAKLLRAIEAREVLRVGGTAPVPIDVRFLAATHRDLPAEIARGAFRLDLYYRLAVVTLTVPPLRERPERLLRLVRELARAVAERAGAPAPAIAPAAIARLQRHSWPGNVRELRNVIERAMLIAAGGELRPAHIVFDPAAPPSSPPPALPAAAPATERGSDERRRIVEALEACAGNQTRAARLLGISRQTLSHKLAVHGIRRPQPR